MLSTPKHMEQLQNKSHITLLTDIKEYLYIYKVENVINNTVIIKINF